jgi:hypothetical protein
MNTQDVPANAEFLDSVGYLAQDVPLYQPTCGNFRHASLPNRPLWSDLLPWE